MVMDGAPSVEAKSFPMPPSDNLKDRLLDDLAKSGFASELRAAEKFKTAGWQLTSSGQVFDSVDNVSKELDIKAWYWGLPKAQPTDLLVSFEILGEVKKTEKAWIVFDPSGPIQVDRTFADKLLIHSHRLKNPDFVAVKIAGQTSAAQTHWVGTGIHEAFKKPNAPSRWFRAFQKISRFAKTRHADMSLFPPHAPALVTLFHPLLILDGQLFAAKIESDEICLREINEAAVQFSEAQPDVNDKPIHVDVVTLNFLPTYLARINKAHVIVTEKALPDDRRTKTED